MKYEKLSLGELTTLMAHHASQKTTAPADLSSAFDAKKKAAKPSDDDADDEAGEDEDEDEEDDEDDKPTAGGNTPAAFSRIAALVPTGESFAVEAFSNEGIWLTGAHMVAVENSLRSQSGTIKKLTTESTQNGVELATAKTELATQTGLVASLTQENGKLKRQDGAKSKTPPPAKTDASISTQSKGDLSTAKTKWDIELEAEAAIINGGKNK
jgi:hypothetical protein